MNEDIVNDGNNALEQDIAPTQTQEKLLTQEHVRSIAAKEKEAGYARGRREAEEQYKRELEKFKQSQQQSEQSQYNNYGGSRQADIDQVYQQVQERLSQDMEQRRLQDEASNVANSYLTKMQQGRELYQDFEEVTKDFDPGSFPQLVYLTHGLENAGDIIYELSKNPQKLVTLNTLAKEAPKMAQAELQRLSRSITENRQATNDAANQGTSSPLNRLQPTRVSGSNGDMSVSELRSMPWTKM